MLGIFTPYRCDETTYAALRLADLAVSRGLDVKVFSTEFHKQRVHSRWDNKVIRGLNAELSASLVRFSQCIHFGVHPIFADVARFYAQTQGTACEQILVADRRCLALPVDALKRHARIVCPNTDLYDRLGAVATLPGLTWCCWDSGLPAISRRGTLTAGAVAALVVCDATVIDGCGAMMLSVLQQLLAACPRLSLTVLAGKSWPKSDRRTLRQLALKYPQRFRVQRLTGFECLTAELHRHDWCVLPSPRTDFGFTAVLALACGVPAMTYDIEPFDQMVLHGHNGMRVACDKLELDGAAPVAIGSVGRWVGAGTRTLGSVVSLIALQKNDWRVANRQSLFEGFWDRIWSGGPQ